MAAPSPFMAAPADGGFDADRYVVDRIEETHARRFVVEHHYSRSFPAAMFSIGLFDRTAPGTAASHPGQHVGTMVLSVPMRVDVLTGVLPDLVPYRESAELGRLVLLDDVPANAESWFVARGLRIAAEEGMMACVAFSDPVPRRSILTGAVVLPGHVGTVYQASNAVYTGRNGASTKVLLPDGTVLDNRSMQKVRAQERGAAGVERRLINLGAPPRGSLEDPREWLANALRGIRAHRFRHPGMHRYVLTTPRARGVRRLDIPAAAPTYPEGFDAAA